MDRAKRVPAIPFILVAIIVALAASPSRARPACDLLRQCAADLADEMARGPESGCGQVWPAATIAQYRRLSATPFETAESTTNICDPMFQVIAVNTLNFYEQRQICTMPIWCKPENHDDLPALPSP